MRIFPSLCPPLSNRIGKWFIRWGSNLCIESEKYSSQSVETMNLSIREKLVQLILSREAYYIVIPCYTPTHIPSFNHFSQLSLGPHNPSPCIIFFGPLTLENVQVNLSSTFWNGTATEKCPIWTSPLSNSFCPKWSQYPPLSQQPLKTPNLQSPPTPNTSFLPQLYPYYQSLSLVCSDHSAHEHSMRSSGVWRRMGCLIFVLTIRLSVIIWLWFSLGRVFGMLKHLEGLLFCLDCGLG